MSNLFSKDVIRKLLDDGLNNEIEKLISKSNYYISNLYKLSNNCKSLQEEHLDILSSLTQKDSKINEMLNFYSDYLRNNKNFLIRNEILKNFVEKVSITKDEKDNLVDKMRFDEKFFVLIDKIINIKLNILVIEKSKTNSNYLDNENFSKNLLYSLKENTLLIEELMNEKIFIFLKTMFRTNKTTSLTDLNNIKKSLSFIYKKENYLNYVLKEYTQYRKKLLDDYLKKKYLSIHNYEEIIVMIIDDFKHHFIKEIILIHYFFGNQQNTNVDLYMILQMYNNSNLELKNQKEYENFLSSFKESFKNEKLDFASFINLLNVILYSFEQITYDNFKKASNIQQTHENISRIYHFYVMSYLYSQNIEQLSKELNISSIDNLSLYGFLINNKKSLSKTIAKCFSDFSKAIITAKTNFKKFLSSTEIFLSENNSQKTVLVFFEEFAKIVRVYHNYHTLFLEKDRENLNPKLNNQSFKVLFEFFNGLDLFKENNLQIICRVINLIDNIIKKFSDLDSFSLIQEEISKLKENVNISINNCVDLIYSLICKQTNFNEENLFKITTYEQMINLIEFILDKSNFFP